VHDWRDTALAPWVEGTPAVNAGVMQDGLSVIAGREDQAAIFDAIDDDILQVARAAPRNGWLPLAVDLHIMHAVSTVVGVERTREVGYASTMATAETPILKPVLKGAVTVFRVKPKAVVRLVARVMPTLYKNIGTLSYADDGATRGILSWNDAPAALYEDDALPWVAGLIGGFEVAYTLCEAEGGVEFVRPQDGGEGPLFRFSWVDGARKPG